MSFDPIKWKIKQQKSQLETVYGENADLVARTQPVKKPVTQRSPSQPKNHSFPHLLNKVHVIEQHNLPKWPAPEERSFKIPDNKRGQYHKVKSEAA